MKITMKSSHGCDSEYLHYYLEANLKIGLQNVSKAHKDCHLLTKIDLDTFLDYHILLKAH